MGFKMFKWVPDGTYDYQEYLTRYVVVNCNPTIVITKMWLDKGGPEDASEELRQPWGSFPDFPPKEDKK
jgi:hypothetical protein